MDDDSTVHLDDNSLMREAADADDATRRSAVEQLYCKYRSFVTSYIIQRTGNNLLVDDMIQEVFLRLWQLRKRFRHRSSVKTYLIGIANNVIKEHTRRSRRKEYILDTREFARLPARQASNTMNEPELEFHRNEIQDAMHAASELLPPKTRKAIVLYFFDGISGQEAARRCNCSYHTFQERLRYAKIRLRFLLKEEKF